ncbi:hypothetical protein C8R45DRAFT_936552 [Mycena sanguinolenta]|nr:hypothetical protein C8R45DRAFT_936552 [Mycena sanguinolenta]
MASSTLSMGNALEATGVCLSVMAAVTQIAPIPYAQEVISLAGAILTTVQRVRSNKIGFQQLAKDIRDLVRAVVDSRVESSAMKKRLKNLVSLLTEIKNFALEHTSHGVLHRIASNSADSSKIQDYRGKIRQALDVFALKAQIDIHENTVQILKELQGTRARSPPADSPAKSPELGSSTESTSVSRGPAVVTNNVNTTLGKFVNCKIGGTVTMTTINGDYTSATMYH